MTDKRPTILRTVDSTDDTVTVEWAFDSVGQREKIRITISTDVAAKLGAALVETTRAQEKRSRYRTFHEEQRIKQENELNASRSRMDFF